MAEEVESPGTEANTRRPALGRFERERRDFVRAHVLDDEHVGFLAAGRAHGANHRVFAAHFALADERPLALVHEVDLRFDGDDVVAARPVDQIHERREQRRPAAVAAAGDEDEAVRLAAERLHLGGADRAGRPRSLAPAPCGR